MILEKLQGKVLVAIDEFSTCPDLTDYDDGTCTSFMLYNYPFEPFPDDFEFEAKLYRIEMEKRKEKLRRKIKNKICEPIYNQNKMGLKKWLNKR